MKAQLLTILVNIAFLASGQSSLDAKRDYCWLIGHKSPTVTYKMDFNYSSPIFTNMPNNVNMYLLNVSISDSNGQLLFYSNGMKIADRYGNVMPNGDSMDYGNRWDWYANIMQNGFPDIYGALILPDPNKNHKNQYYYLQTHIDWETNTTYHRYSDGIRYSIIDMNLNNGLGDLSIREQYCMYDSMTSGGLSAVRHGNGRDWWIVAPCVDNKSYYRILLNPEGFEVLPKQLCGNIQSTGDVFTTSYVNFSPDGKWFVQAVEDYIGQHFINLFSFDRCTGNLSFTADLSFVNSKCGSMVSFSPDSKLLYFITEDEISQYKLDTSDISNSKKLVASYVSSGGLYGWDYFGLSTQLGPDSKIYIGAGQTKYLHVINKPNLRGSNCEFIQRAVTLPYKIFQGGLTTYPNFRLGRWEGSDCDYLYNGIEENVSLRQLNAFPNPANQMLNLDLSAIQLTENAQLQIIDALGRLVEQHTLTPYQAVLNIDVSFWASGIYSCQVHQKGQWIATARFGVSR